MASRYPSPRSQAVSMSAVVPFCVQARYRTSQMEVTNGQGVCPSSDCRNLDIVPLRFEPGPQPEEAFRMQGSSTSPVFGTETELAIGECDRVVQHVGPYLRLVRLVNCQKREFSITPPACADVRVKM